MSMACDNSFLIFLKLVYSICFDELSIYYFQRNRPKGCIYSEGITAREKLHSILKKLIFVHTFLIDCLCILFHK